MPIINLVYEAPKREPGSDTILYMPLKSDAIDTERWQTWTATQTTFWTYRGVECAYINKWKITITPWDNFAHDWTVSIWYYWETSIGWDDWIWSVGSASSWRCICPFKKSSGEFAYTEYWYDLVWPSFLNQQWQNIILTYSYSSRELNTYRNWEKVTALSATPRGQYTITSPTIYLGNIVGRAWSSDTYEWYYSQFIIESKVRTPTEIASYYNQTKANYWL